jgi:four helix bundle protein
MGDRRRMTEDRRKATEDKRSPLGSDPPANKLQRLDVYGLALEYLDRFSAVTGGFPGPGRFNLRSQSERAATSVVPDTAGGSNGRTDPGQVRFISTALRSYLETVACLDTVERREYLSSDGLRLARDSGHQLFVKLQALRRDLRALSPVPRVPYSRHV